MIRRLVDSGLIFVALSLLVHTSILIGMVFTRIRPPTPHSEVVEVSYETKPDAQASVAVQKRTKSESLEHPIVEQNKQLNDELDVNSDRLSAFNQRVEKETRASRSGKFNNSALGGPTQKSQVAHQSDAQKESKKQDLGELPNLDSLIPKMAQHSEPQRTESADSANPGQPSQTDDYLPEVQTGVQTLLSTREFVYFSYYQRIKDQIRQYWEPGVREKVKIIYRQGRTIASQKDRTTQLMIILDSQGTLIRIEVLSSSGINQLDDAAVEAFKAAAPFPNPPSGMVESDGTIKIRWDFILEARIDRVERVFT